MTKYARDEFDRVPETSTRQGVHRAVAASRRRSLAPILAAGCVALAIGLVAFLILPKLGFSAGQAAAVTAGGSASASASSTPSATSTVSPSPTPTSPDTAGTVASDGWVLGETGNWGGVPQQTSVIFYSGVEQKDNAEALGALLGVDTLVDSAEFNRPLVVVLGPGYQ